MEERYCDYCYEPLERKPNETKQNWEKRRFCDKVCAGVYTVERRKKGKRYGLLALPEM